jgi:hypothetical protein
MHLLVHKPIRASSSPEELVPQNPKEETAISTRNLNKPSFILPSYLEHPKNRFT